MEFGVCRNDCSSVVHVNVINRNVVGASKDAIAAR